MKLQYSPNVMLETYKYYRYHIFDSENMKVIISPISSKMGENQYLTISLKAHWIIIITSNLYVCTV